MPKGHKKSDEYRPFDVDTIFDRDISIPMRDGVVLKADVFRPATSEGGEPVPVLIVWSSYGKSDGGAYVDKHVFFQFLTS